MRRRNKPEFLNPKKCKQTGKTIFKKQSQASYAMMRTISHTTTDMFDLHTYLCPSCSNWHFGHKSYFEKSLAKNNEVSTRTA
jgi:hypothetical protein